jgi:hypothetical protein
MGAGCNWTEREADKSSYVETNPKATNYLHRNSSQFRFLIAQDRLEQNKTMAVCCSQITSTVGPSSSPPQSPLAAAAVRIADSFFSRSYRQY